MECLSAITGIRMNDYAFYGEAVQSNRR